MCSMSQPRRLCTFYLDGLFFGIDVGHVQEVFRYQNMTQVPLAPAVIRGLINLRGQIVTALDLRSRLGLAPRPAEQTPMNVVVRSGRDAVSFLVDAIEDVLEVDEQDFEAPPATLRGSARALIQGSYKLKDRLLLVLDTDQALRLDAVP
jgi:purine-binding chemotaxis protein CheW